MSCLIQSLQLGHGQSLEVSVRQTSKVGMVDWALIVMGKDAGRLGLGSFVCPFAWPLTSPCLFLPMK